MNKKLLDILEKYEKDKLYKKPIEAGGLEKQNEIVVDMRKKVFLIELKNLIRENNGWLKILFGLLIMIIGFLSVLIWRHQNDQVYFFSLLGGQGLSILFCINRLSLLYNQKRTSELLLHLYVDAESDAERAKIIREIIDFLRNKEKVRKLV